MAKVPQVLVLGVVGLPADLQGHIVGLGIVDLLVAALDVPLTPGGDDLHLGGEALDGQLKAHLVVALAGAAVADRVGTLRLGDLYQPLGDDGTGEGGAQQIVLILGSHHHGGDDDVIYHLICQVLHVQLGGAGLDGLLLQAVQLGPLSHIAGDSDDLGVTVILFQPGDDDGCIQAAGIGQYHFFDLRHSSFPPDYGRAWGRIRAAAAPHHSMLREVYHRLKQKASAESYDYPETTKNIPFTFTKNEYYAKKNE